MVSGLEEDSHMLEEDPQKYSSIMSCLFLINDSFTYPSRNCSMCFNLVFGSTDSWGAWSFGWTAHSTTHSSGRYIYFHWMDLGITKLDLERSV